MKIIDATDQKQWDDFVTSHPEANFLQAWAWGDFHLARNKKIVRRIAVDDKNKILSAYVGEIETAKRGTYMAIAGGPIMDWSDSKLVKAIFQDIKEQAEDHNCVFVRVRPQLEASSKSEKLFQKYGFKSAPYYLSVELAGVLDLSQSEEEIKKNSATRIRRALNKARRENVTVEISEDPKDIKKFYQIQLETANRHKFFAFSEDFLRKQFEAFAKYGQVKLYIAKHEGKILAENFMIFYGNEASYHYGVSSEAGTKISSAPLLHFTAMEDARRQGIKRYNFWGITGENETKHRFYGVSQFKRGFGVTELKYLHAQDLVLKPFAYKLNWLVETLRSKLRHV